MINVTKTYLPPIEEYKQYLDGIWERNQLTNNGPLVQELEQRLKEYLGVKYCFFVSNGTIALQIALKVLGIQKEVITTPFSYCATSHAIVWENCIPVFADISPKDLCIDPLKVESLITENTQAILATHVYGNPCEVEKLAEIAKKNNLKLIYDAAHCFGVKVNDNSIFNYGDISTCSFHSTKVFHTTEGGAIFTNDDKLAFLINNYRSFGHKGDDYQTIGINGKNSEFHAAMGLCVLPNVSEIIENRRKIFELYDSHLNWNKLFKSTVAFSTVPNFAYYPIFLESESVLLSVKEKLEANGIVPRRYFYPSLSTLKFVTDVSNCPISDDLAVRALALPLYFDLAHADVIRISEIINSTIS